MRWKGLILMLFVLAFLTAPSGENGEAAPAVGNAEIQARELRRVTNEYCEDTLKRTEEAVALSLEEIRKVRQRFKSIAK